MPRNYQCKKNNPYRLPHNLYMQMLYLIGSYKQLLERREKVQYGDRPLFDGQPKGSTISKPTEKKALTLIVIDGQIEAIEQVMFELQVKYANTYTGERFEPLEAFRDYGTFCYFRSKKGKKQAPSAKTWNRYRSEFAYKVAKKLNLF